MSEIEIDVEFIHETDLAALFETGVGKKWIPKSVIKDQSDDELCDCDSIFIPEWFALDEGLI